MVAVTAYLLIAHLSGAVLESPEQVSELNTELYAQGQTVPMVHVGPGDRDDQSEIFKERLLCKLGATESIEAVAFGDSGRTVAHIVSMGGKHVLYLLGERKSDWDRVVFPVVASRGASLAFIALRNGCYNVVIGSTVIELPTGSPTPIALSDRGDVYALGVMKPGECAVISSSRGASVWDEIYPPLVSRDGATIAFRCRKGASWNMVINAIPGKTFDRIGDPQFTSDGKGILYSAVKDGKSYLVAGERIMEIGRRAFSVVSGSTEDLPFYVGPDSEGGDLFVWHGEVKHSTRPFAGHLTLGSKSAVPSFVTRVKDGRFAVVTGGIVGPAFDAISDLVVSATGEVCAYWAVDGQTTFVVLDGKRSEPFEVVDNLPTHVSGRGPYLSADAQSVAFGCRTKSEIWWKVLRKSPR
jgi:hypothetical protein